MQSKAKIFLSDERGCQEADGFRSYSTFNFGNFEHKYPFHNLYLLNDETIAGGHSINFGVEETSYLLLLPVVGTVLCKLNQSVDSIVHVGQLKILRVRKDDSIEFFNYYRNELINFIQVWIKAGNIKDFNTRHLFNFSLGENKNQLIKITKAIVPKEKDPVVSIGKFTGRNEAVYRCQNKHSNLFIFIIEGVFEVQARLLHAKDGLGFWNEPQVIEMEALSNDAILFLVEFN